MRHQFKSMPHPPKKALEKYIGTGAKTSFEFIPEKRAKQSITSLGKNRCLVNLRRMDYTPVFFSNFEFLFSIFEVQFHGGVRPRNL